MDVIDTVLLPEILNITTEGAETVIILGTSSGRQQAFVVIDESALAPEGSPFFQHATDVVRGMLCKPPYQGRVPNNGRGSFCKSYLRCHLQRSAHDVS